MQRPIALVTWTPQSRLASQPASQPVWIQHLDRLHLLTPLRVAAIVLAAGIVTLIVRRVVTNTTRHVLDRTGSGDGPRARARHKAISSALRAALVGVIWGIAVITAMDQIGINIGGFIATATVIGGAIAFGAQTLIRDIIAGFFVLSDDQYGVGDEVDLGLASGTVERVTLRSVRLRDVEGRIWHVAHGNVMRVANLNKAATALLEADVSRAMPIDVLLAALQGIVAEFADDPDVGPLLLTAPLVVGIVGHSDDRITVRVNAPSHVGRKAEVERAWQLALLRAFEKGTLAAPQSNVPKTPDAGSPETPDAVSPDRGGSGDQN